MTLAGEGQPVAITRLEYTAHLKWLVEPRTASSNSIGPGISRVGCSAWLDIFCFFSSGEADFGGSLFKGV